MRYYIKRNISTESICIDKITKGIQSIRKGTRTGESVGKDLEFFFNKLETVNKGMCQELYISYCMSRIETEKELEDIHHSV
tara:strand:+ start:912 stop:1154 length:243 start_codon:yes stop_codon:yes gene_type:complete